MNRKDNFNFTKIASWADTVDLLAHDPRYSEFFSNSYLASEIVDSWKAYCESSEWKAIEKIITSTLSNVPGSIAMDMPCGNGIGTYALTKLGFDVMAVDPERSSHVGTGAVDENLEVLQTKVKTHNCFGEKLPFADNYFDFVFVRQGLHHADDLNVMCGELYRVLKPGGLLIAAREHVVNNYTSGLKEFLMSQPDHRLYGGEFAYTLSEYISSLTQAGFRTLKTIRPYSNDINLSPRQKSGILGDSLLSKILPNWVSFFLYKIIRSGLRKNGRLYTFVGKK